MIQIIRNTMGWTAEAVKPIRSKSIDQAFGVDTGGYSMSDQLLGPRPMSLLLSCFFSKSFIWLLCEVGYASASFSESFFSILA